MSARLRLVFAAAIVLGVFFRLYHADLKLYSPEEIATSLFAAGHTNGDITALLRDGVLHRISDIRTLLLPGPDASAAATWRAIALEHPQHPPLYFELMIEPSKLAGDAVFLRRLPAIAFGIFAIAAAAWFARRLGGDTATGWCMAALVASSPFHVAYAQENREYSLYTLLICLSCGLLVAALQDGKRVGYALYGLSVALGMWTFTAFAIVIAAHACYVAVPWRGIAARRRLWAGVSLALGTATFVPWLVILITRAGVAVEDMGWEAATLPATLYVGKWLFNAGSMFFDLDYLSLAFVPVALIALAIAAYACGAFARTVPARVWALPALLGALTLLVTLIPDLVRHEERALQARYLTTLWLAIELATAGGLCALASAAVKRSVLWQTALAGVLLAGLVSDAVAAQARTWWNTGSTRNRAIPAIVDRLRSEPSPTIVYMDYPVEILMYERGPDDMGSFRMHATLDLGALRSAPHAYAVLSPSELAGTPVASQLLHVPLTLGFEMRANPAIMRLRDLGNAARGAKQLDLNPALYAARSPGTPR